MSGNQNSKFIDSLFNIIYAGKHFQLCDKQSSRKK